MASLTVKLFDDGTSPAELSEKICEMLGIDIHRTPGLVEVQINIKPYHGPTVHVTSESRLISPVGHRGAK